MIETSGERFIGDAERSHKDRGREMPDSGEPDTFDPRNLEELSANDEVKFVISSRKDYEFAREFSRDHRLSERYASAVLAVHDDPNGKWTGLEPRELVGWMLEDGLPAGWGCSCIRSCGPSHAVFRPELEGSDSWKKWTP